MRNRSCIAALVTPLVPGIVAAPAPTAQPRCTVRGLRVRVANGGTVEVRFGAPDGPLPGSVAVPRRWPTPAARTSCSWWRGIPARPPDLFTVDWSEFQPEV